MSTICVQPIFNSSNVYYVSNGLTLKLVITYTNIEQAITAY